MRNGEWEKEETDRQSGQKRRVMSNATAIDKLLLGGFLVSTEINNNNHARMYLINKNDD